MPSSAKNSAGEPVSDLPLEVFDAAPVAVALFVGGQHLLSYHNEAYRRIFGERPVGTPVREAFPDLVELSYIDLLDRVREKGEVVQLASAPVTVQYSDGTVETRHFSLNFSPTAQAGPEPGVLVVLSEVTEHVNETEYVRLLAEERRRAMRRYQSLVATGAQVWVADPQGRLIEGGEEWETVTGRPWREIRGWGWTDLVHPDDREQLVTAWSRAVAEAPELFEYTCRLRRADGGYRHYTLRTVPLREDDRVVEWAGTCTDVEEWWLRRRRTELLGRAAGAISRTHDVPGAFAALSPLIVPALADECGIYLLPEPSGRVDDTGPLVVQRLAATAREGLPPGLPPRQKESLPPDHAFARAVRERRPFQLSFPPGEVPDGFVPPNVQPWLRLARAHSGVILPVQVDGAVAAVATAFVCEGRPPIDVTDRDLMHDLIEQAHAPLSRALHLQRAQEVARALQHSLLTEPPRLTDLRITARYLPSPAAAEVGGDWYDSFVLPDGAAMLAIGDVAGHDLEAAVTMGKMRNMLRGLAADRKEPPGEILRRMDLALQILNPEEATATCVLGRVEGPPGGSRVLNYSVAGHPPPLVVTADGRAEFLEGARSPLLGGLLPDEPRESAAHTLLPGSTLLLYTDGLVERPEEHLDQGLERLRRHAARLAREPVDAFCDGLLTESSATGRDDIALLALRLPGPAAGAGPVLGHARPGAPEV